MFIRSPMPKIVSFARQATLAILPAYLDRFWHASKVWVQAEEDAYFTESHAGDDAVAAPDLSSMKVEFS